MQVKAIVRRLEILGEESNPKEVIATIFDLLKHKDRADAALPTLVSKLKSDSPGVSEATAMILGVMGEQAIKHVLSELRGGRLSWPQVNRVMLMSPLKLDRGVKREPAKPVARVLGRVTA